MKRGYLINQNGGFPLAYLGENPKARVPCPECLKENLVVYDIHCSEDIFLRMRRPNQNEMGNN